MSPATIAPAGCPHCGRAHGQLHRPTCSGGKAGRPVVDGAPHARREDPQTSHTAAESARPVASEVRAHVLEAIREAGRDAGLHGLIDEELVALFAARGWPGTPSGIRTRRRELVDSDPPLVVETHYRRNTATGRTSIVWAPAPLLTKGRTT